jgi:DNA replication initiation complex subunit (GINS family)
VHVPNGLTPEEHDIYRKLHEKVEVLKQKEEENKAAPEKKEDPSDWYSNNMKSLRELIGIA